MQVVCPGVYLVHIPWQAHKLQLRLFLGIIGYKKVKEHDCPISLYFCCIYSDMAELI